MAWTLPPPYPIFFNLTYTFSIFRLWRKEIFLIDPQKTVKTGKVKSICFDKTGTITESKMRLFSFFDFTLN